MESAALLQALQQAVPGAIALEVAPSIDQQLTVYVPAPQLAAIARALRDLPELRFSLLAELTAVDYWPREPRFEVVYILVSLTHRRRLRMKVRLSADAARLDTVSGIWPAANWLEREVWDLFGIVFEGHPEPRRLLMPEDWEGFPLRKDYPVQINMPARTAEPTQVTEQEFRASILKDRLAR